MCFSATASFVAGGALVLAGGATLTRAKTKEQMPLASIPLLFGAQQLVEGVVWVSFGHPIINAMATHAYVIFSHVLWPFFIPLAVMLIEPGPTRKRVLRYFLLFGAAVSVLLYWYVSQGPVSCVPGPHGLVYDTPAAGDPFLLAAYLLATCVACLFSSHKFIRTFGLALLGGLIITLWMYHLAFYSVWCFFSAILSFIIYVHLAQRHKNPGKTVKS